jgi:Tol biopolymer transport system component/tRNA A-37 threonylcarbamoyl transferase component Bud32
MTLTPGTRLGPYEILGEIGAGGMGNVYRARDTRLDREVAVKTLKGTFTERFEREARAISSLNHPNICTLFDVGEYEGTGYLVMEYVEGKTLAGPLPFEQAIPYAVQICEALHAAHRKGIIHRDLKPANILLTKQGVKLLDFGLAKLDVATVGSSPDLGTAAERATIAALTGAHTIVGTPQYMAPEQIEGREVDARTDIFAFGCVLYELLTGQRPFEGKTPSSVMAAILASQPRSLEEVAPLTPPALERVVSRCLEKDPDDRWQTARDVTAELQWVAKGGSRVGLPAVITGRRRNRERLAWAACVVATLAAIGFAIAWVRRAPTPAPVVRFAVPVPEHLISVGPSALSPDGRFIAFDGADAGGRRQIWIRALDALEPRPLSGTEGTSRPFWSPDSRQLAFFSGGKLKKIAVSGGSPQVICDAPRGSDGSWGADGTILFDGGAQDPIWKVPATGGVAQTMISTPKDAAVGWPEFLPDGRHFLYSVFSGAGSDQSVMVGTIDSNDPKQLVTTGSRVQYAEPGFLIYVRDQTLVAHPFDPKGLAFTGEPIPIGEGLGVDAVGLASFTVSRNGILAFRTGEGTSHQFILVDRSGKEAPLIETTGQYRDAWFSPDGRRLVFDALSSEGSDLWIRDLVRGVTSRFTFDAAPEVSPIWSPDGRRIVFTVRKEGATNLWIKDASGAREAELLLKTADEKYASDWTRDGSYLIYATRSAATGWDQWAVRLTGDKKAFPLAKTRFNELFGTVSPDGRFLAYFSDESGQMEIYVQEFPEPQNKWQVSASGGREPFWSADGRTLYFRDAANGVMAVSVDTTSTFSAGIPQRLFQTRFAPVVARAHFRPAPDGRFLVLAPTGTQTVNPTSVVLNWTSALGN